MIYFSSLLKTNEKYKPAADRLFAALDTHGIRYGFIENTHDIWVRDFMPVKTKSGKYVSFRYEPSYLDGYPELHTDFRKEIAPQFSLKNLVYSDINLDGGNIIFSPSRETVIISDRVFSENFDYPSAKLVRELERLLEARVIIIPSLRSDFTGHADGMARFINENAAADNYSNSLFGLEANICATLRNHGIEVYDLPYFHSKGNSAVGCYINFLETEHHLLLPVFGADTDNEAIKAAESLFKKAVIPIEISEIAKDGGALNCISWER